jgi:hypothetical protein
MEVDQHSLYICGLFDINFRVLENEKRLPHHSRSITIERISYGFTF